MMAEVGNVTRVEPFDPPNKKSEALRHRNEHLHAGKDHEWHQGWPKCEVTVVEVRQVPPPRVVLLLVIVVPLPPVVCLYEPIYHPPYNSHSYEQRKYQ